ncbi:hypothetical protein [Trichothermofontia sp.]
MLAAVRSILCLAMCNPAATDDTQQGGGNQEKLEALEAFVKKYPPQTDLDKALCQFLKDIYQSGFRCIRSNDASLLLIYKEFKKSYQKHALKFLRERGIDEYVSQELAEEASSEIWCYFLKTCHEFDVNYREQQSSYSSDEENFHITTVIKNKTFKSLDGWLQEKLAKEIYSTPQSLDQTIGENDEPLINTIADPNPEINPGLPTLSDLDNLPLGEMGFQPSPEIAAET